MSSSYMDERQMLAMMLGKSVEDFCPTCLRPLDSNPSHDTTVCAETKAQAEALLEKGIVVEFSDGTTEVWDSSNTRLI